MLLQTQTQSTSDRPPPSSDDEDDGSATSAAAAVSAILLTSAGLNRSSLSGSVYVRVYSAARASTAFRVSRSVSPTCTLSPPAAGSALPSSLPHSSDADREASTKPAAQRLAFGLQATLLSPEQSVGAYRAQDPRRRCAAIPQPPRTHPPLMRRWKALHSTRSQHRLGGDRVRVGSVVDGYQGGHLCRSERARRVRTPQAGLRSAPRPPPARR